MYAYQNSKRTDKTNQTNRDKQRKHKFQKSLIYQKLLVGFPSSAISYRLEAVRDTMIARYSYDGQSKSPQISSKYVLVAKEQ